MHPQNRRTPLVRTLLVAGVIAAVAFVGSSVPQSPDRAQLAATANPPTPGDFVGLGFDQCLAPTQRAMDVWLNNSPFLSVGIYISGNSRACRSQPNLTPAWVSAQLRKGWHLLPITLGPQASCSHRYPKYNDDPTINPDPYNKYGKARAQGRLEADRAVNAAQSLGIVPGSTLFYDLEGWDYSSRTTALARCHRSALRFTIAWTNRLHALGYKSGFYSSGASGIKMMDDARRAGWSNLPDTLWIARWDGQANTTVSTDYLATDAWTPHRRVKQFQGGHNETWGGVTINIDRNFLDVGRGYWAPAENHCGGVRVNYLDYPAMQRGAAWHQVVALKCLLQEQGYGGMKLNRWFGSGLEKAAMAWQADHGFAAQPTWTPAHWTALHAVGPAPVLKLGTSGSEVRRLQRALNAAGASLKITGQFTGPTDNALRDYQRSHGLKVTGNVTGGTWASLRNGG